jgi:hypothetical protein
MATPLEIPPRRRFFLLQKILDRTRQRPQNLSEEGVDALKRSKPVKLGLRWLFFLMGIYIVYQSYLFLIEETSIDGLYATIKYERVNREADLSFLVGMLIMCIGAWLISRISLNTNYLRQNTTYLPHLSLRREPLLHQSGDDGKLEERDFFKVRSFASSRLIAAMLMIMMSIVNLIVFGVELTGENHVGNWLVLGGPSLFYPLSVLPLFFAVGLLLYSMFSSAIITFSKSKNFFFIEEHRFMAPWLTEIPRKDVRAIRLSNGHTGAKYLWIFVFGLHMIWLYVDGFHFLLNPFAYGAGIQAGIYYITTATVQLIVLLILTLRTQLFLEIITEDKRYELQIALPSSMPNVRGAIEEILEIPALNHHNKRFQKYRVDLDAEIHHDGKLKRRFVKDWRNIFAGFAFFLIALFSQIYLIYAGDPLRLVLYMFGFMLILKGFKEDFSSPRLKFGAVFDEPTKSLYFRKEWAWFNTVYKFLNCEPANVKYESRVQKLGFFETMMGLIIPFILGMDIAAIFIFVPYMPQFAKMRLIHVAGLILIMGLLFLVIIRPSNTLRVQTSYIDFEFPIPGTQTVEQYRQLKEAGFFKKGFSHWISALKMQTGTFLLRIFIMFFALIAGALALMYFTNII